MTLSRVHLSAALLATLTIVLFFVSTVVVEATGGHAAVARVKSLIVVPGLFVLVPAIAVTGGTGFVLSRGWQGAVVARKKRRMPVIAKWAPDPRPRRHRPRPVGRRRHLRHEFLSRAGRRAPCRRDELDPDGTEHSGRAQAEWTPASEPARAAAPHGQMTATRKGEPRQCHDALKWTNG
jgi:hypothetical protein